MDDKHYFQTNSDQIHSLNVCIYLQIHLDLARGLANVKIRGGRARHGREAWSWRTWKIHFCNICICRNIAFLLYWCVGIQADKVNQDLEGKLLWKASRPHDTSSKHPLSDFLLSLLSHILISIIGGIQRPLMYVCMRLNREGRKCREHLLKREAEVVPWENLLCSQKQKRC